MQLRWFHISGGVCIAPGCVYRSSSAKRGVGIPGDRIKRVETYQHHRAAISRQPSFSASRFSRTQLPDSSPLPP